MSKNVIRSMSGEWGTVRAEVVPDAGTFKVLTSINGLPQKPIYGLDAEEAIDTAHEYVIEQSEALATVYERRLTVEVATDFVRQETVITPPDARRMPQLVLEANSTMPFESPKNKCKFVLNRIHALRCEAQGHF